MVMDQRTLSCIFLSVLDGPLVLLSLGWKAKTKRNSTRLFLAACDLSLGRSSA
jgi:hypothetical protein